MATKSKNNGLYGSIIAIVLALASFLYCSSFITGAVIDGWQRTVMLAQYVFQLIGGNVQ